jgi:two-component system sensor histidine kinase MprB
VSLRARLTLILCATVAVAVVLVSIIGYAAVRRQLLDDIDRQLDQRAEFAASSAAVSQARRDDEEMERVGRFVPEAQRRPQRGLAPVDPFADPETSFQLIDATGAVIDRPGGTPLDLPVGDVDRTIASRPAGASTFRDVEVDGGRERMLTMAVGDNVAVQVARSLEQTDETLDTLVLLFALVGGVVITFAVTTGLVVTRRSLQPIARLTDTAEQIARTHDVSTTIDESRRDEVGRLAGAFNEMLQTLASAREQQRQLVADASHELRTPLTSLRTNIEVLSRAAERGQLDDESTRALMADVRVELEALSVLVAEIVDLATDAATRDGIDEDVDLGALVDDAGGRAGRRFGLLVDVRLVEPETVTGDPALLDRAVSNLLENAAKWDHSGLPVEVTVEHRSVQVRDHGPGLAGADPARIFDRFYRGPQSQRTPGSGLGLAIVKQVVERHGGRVHAADAAGGGAVVGFELPPSVGHRPDS